MYGESRVTTKRIGKYIVKELLARGGMGEIYKASHPTLERDVAIKVIHTHKASDPQIVDRFQREAKVVAALRHPGIIQVYDFDVEDDAFYMVMEFVPGESLAQRLGNLHIQGKQLPLHEIIRLFQSITEAVAYAHNRGVIHCDLKPSNVLLTLEGQAVLADFGISKIINAERLTATNDILGTPHYMAPEQGFGREIDAQADVYALGVMLYELTTGKLPFNGNSPMSIVFKHINEQPRQPRSINPYLPEAVEQIIQKAMAKDPAMRYASAQELLVDLQALTPLLSASKDVFKPIEGQLSLFICYKQNTNPDQTLATYLYESLTGQGYRVFIDKTVPTATTWLEQIDQQLKESDFLIVLLSKASADSEMVKSELSRAYEYYKLHGKPNIIPIRVAYEGLLPYTIAAFLEPLQSIVWQNEADNALILKETLNAISGQYQPSQRPAWVSSAFQTSVVSEDGQPISNPETSSRPLPAFDPRFLKELIVPGGAVKLRDKLYIERSVDPQLKDQIIKWGTTTTIRAPRQTGKTSLLMRGIQYAREQGAHVVFQDFQSFGSDQLASLDLFLEELAESICDELGLDEETIEEAWEGSRSGAKKLLRFMEKHVLPAFDRPVVLAMDEADSLLQTDFYKDFFGLLRSWHNRRASREVWEKLNLVLVISTEPYLLIDDIHQSPFNVGLHLHLSDFDEMQVRTLNLRHGSPVAEYDIPHLMTLLHGHPYLTRLAMYTMVTEGVNWADLNHFAADDYGPFGDHLRHQYWTIHDKPELKNALREVIRSNHCTNETALFRLLQAGLIKGAGNAYTCRCDLYKLYFEDKLF
jgi:serine/threonine protein kinase